MTAGGILVYPGMVGWVEFTPPRHYRLVISSDDSTTYFEDLWLFGRVCVVSTAPEQAILAKLGRIRCHEDLIWPA